MIQQASTDATILGPLCPAFPESWVGALGCTLAEWEAVALAALALVVMGAVALAIMARRREAEALQGPTFLVFPLHSRGRAREPSGPAASDPSPEPSPAAASEEEDRSARPETSGSAEGKARPGPQHPWREPAPETPPAADSPDQRMTLPPEARRPDPETERHPGTRKIEAGHVSFEEPPEGTLQLLPGRLEIQSGTGHGREIRFVRVPGTQPEITFGRSEGPPYRHVQLDSPTVSRQHARLCFQEGRWLVRNESSTNPTLLNGALVDGTEETSVLQDGDRIEMGEVVFLFHQPDIHDRLPFRSSWFTDRGRRSTNQDAVAVRTLSDRRELAVVCDGMGSHTAGELASHDALEALVSALDQGETLKAAVHRANAAVRKHATGDPDTAGIGTTLVALLRQGGQYELANVGDSRAYRVGPERIVQVTVDHSFVAEAVREGRMSFDEASRSPWKNAVTRHLGASDPLDVDVFGSFSADEPHLIVLCSDGAHSVLSAEEIDRLVRRTPHVQDMAREIGEAALREGSDDNVSVVVLEFGGGLSGT